MEEEREEGGRESERREGGEGGGREKDNTLAELAHHADKHNTTRKGSV